MKAGRGWLALAVLLAALTFAVPMREDTVLSPEPIGSVSLTLPARPHGRRLKYFCRQRQRFYLTRPEAKNTGPWE